MQTLELTPLLPFASTADPEYVRDVANTKRFLEYWSADPAFRAELPQDPVGVSKAAGLVADPEAIRSLWSLDPNDPSHRQAPSPSVLRYGSFMSEKFAYRTNLRTSADSTHPGYKAWRQRQINRCFGQLGGQKGDSLVHACLAVELCAGCSVGCWFCGISALKLEGVWPYSPENARLWKGVLGALQQTVGPAAGRGFCYWATDPLDNPDYETFCSDYADLLGRFPQTTTAQPIKDPARFRKLHQLSRRRGNEIDRFSVLTLGTLKKLFAEYTAEELLFVELVLQMDGAYNAKAYAGKARSKQERWKKSTGQEPPPDEYTSTIACVSGILLRMPERSFELVSPSRADERWPNGYRIHARRTFGDVDDFCTQLEEVLSALPVRLPLDQPLRLRHDIQPQILDNGFELVSHYYKLTFSDESYAAMRLLGEGLAQGNLSASQLALRAEPISTLEQTMMVLNQLFNSGLLDDEP
ncbi:radical SAM family RiPP maturation amino acid epimerase [bacterium]|nr:radical SAM family RiPP maturation amino acid epimerase [bacterium]